MATYHFERFINAPLERVFALASDFANAPENIAGITKVEMLTPGSVGVGTRFRETRKFGGREATETMEVTAFDPPHGYTLEARSCGAHFVSQFAFTPDGAGTRLNVSFGGTAETFWAKLMMPLSWLMAGMVKKCIEADLEQLKAASEKAAAT